MLKTPKGLRLQIGIFGRRNAGKSSLLNALTGQQVSIVSDTPGTTADPVEKPLELPPFGPVLLIDTAGLDDDSGELGALRAEKSARMLDRTDLALLVSESSWGKFEDDLAEQIRQKHIPLIAVFNKIDRGKPDPALLKKLDREKTETVMVSAADGTGMEALRDAILRQAPEGFFQSQGMLDGIVQAGRPVLLITPVDREAPRGRMILPQVQAIRDALDHDAWCAVVKENAVTAALESLKEPPALAVTDSQVFKLVEKMVPGSIPLTSFSILMARIKGDLAVCAEGAAAIGKLTNDSTVMIAEACSHPPIEEDIGRVKLPGWLRQHGLPGLRFKFVQGHDFPDDLSGIDLVIHCGACMFNRREVLSRILQCRRQGVPFTNYGTAIAFCFGILERALAPFPEILSEYRKQTERKR